MGQLISNLPDWLQQLARQREREQHPRRKILLNILVDTFIWDQTPEGDDFWYKIYQGIFPEEPKDIINTEIY